MKKKHTQRCVAVLHPTSLIFYFTVFCAVSKMLREKKNMDPTKQKIIPPPASGSARKIATIMDFSVKAPSKVDCKV